MPEYLKLLNISDENIIKDGPSWQVSFGVPADLPWFSGHFPGQPILPAVITAEISDALISYVSGRSPMMITGAKFKGPVLPRMNITLSIQCNSEKETASILWQDAAATNTGDFLADLSFKL